MIEKNSFGEWVERLFTQHKFMRRFTMFWAMGLITYIVVFTPALESSKFLGVVGLFATAIGLYQWDKMRG